MTTPVALLLPRLARARRLYRRGRRYGYPLCCVVRFSWDALPARKLGSGERRGTTHPRADGERWVPCGLLHRCDPVETAWFRAELAARTASSERTDRP
jgi:hypothetical protein